MLTLRLRWHPFSFRAGASAAGVRGMQVTAEKEGDSRAAAAAVGKELTVTVPARIASESPEGVEDRMVE